jgi:Protein of unknown function (DUF2946)
MRRQLQKFLPVFLIALAVQVLAPIASSWTAAIAASNPLGAAEICSHDPSEAHGSGGDQGADHRTYHSLCSICCAAQASAALDTPNHLAVAVLHRQPARVVWQIGTPDWGVARTGSNAQARAPPRIS